MSKKPSRLTVADRHNLKGWLFVIPFLIGFLVFYLQPIIESITFSFSDVKAGVGGYNLDFIGLGNYNYILKEHASYTTSLIASFLNILWQTPVSLILSLFFAILMNSKFKGRTFFRCVLFLPVILSGGILLNTIQGDLVVSNTLNSNSLLDTGGAVDQTLGLREILIQSGIQENLVDWITKITNSFFGLVWQTGIQTLIFLSGLQGISGSLYEAASVEGASAWESFCRITVPLLSPIMLLNAVYTIVDTYAGAGGVMSLVLGTIEALKYGRAAAMAWLYFVLIGIVIALVFVAFRLMSRANKES